MQNIEKTLANLVGEVIAKRWLRQQQGRRCASKEKNDAACSGENVNAMDSGGIKKAKQRRKRQ